MKQLEPLYNSWFHTSVGLSAIRGNGQCKLRVVHAQSISFGRSLHTGGVCTSYACIVHDGWMRMWQRYSFRKFYQNTRMVLFTKIVPFARLAYTDPWRRPGSSDAGFASSAKSLSAPRHFWSYCHFSVLWVYWNFLELCLTIFGIRHVVVGSWGHICSPSMCICWSLSIFSPCLLSACQWIYIGWCCAT